MFKVHIRRLSAIVSRLAFLPAVPAVDLTAPPKLRRRNARYQALRDAIYRHIGIYARQRKIRAERGDDAGIEAYLASHLCLYPFTKLDATHRGLAHFCCSDWLPTPIGDLDSDLLDAWSSPVAHRIRASIANGSYAYCSRTACRYISERLLPHRDSDEARAALAAFADRTKPMPPPKHIGLLHDDSCNLACPSCRTGLIVADRAAQERLDRQFETAILPLLKTAENVYIGGAADAFGSPHLRRVLKRFHDEPYRHLKIDLSTNGQLFDARAFESLHLGGRRLNNIEVSIDAADPETYAVLRRGGRFDLLLENLAYIERLKDEGEIRSLSFSMVVQERNFREMPAFVRLGQQFGADQVWFQMIRNWGTYSAAEFKRVFIGDPSHPRHRELAEVLNAPELALPIAKIGNIASYVQPGHSRI